MPFGGGGACKAQSIHIPKHTSLRMPMRMSVCMSVHMFMHMSIRMSIRALIMAIRVSQRTCPWPAGRTTQRERCFGALTKQRARWVDACQCTAAPERRPSCLCDPAGSEGYSSEFRPSRTRLKVRKERGR